MHLHIVPPRPPGARLRRGRDTHTHTRPSWLTRTRFCSTHNTHARVSRGRHTLTAVVRHVTQSPWLLEIQFAFSMEPMHARDTSHVDFFLLFLPFFFCLLSLFVFRSSSAFSFSLPPFFLVRLIARVMVPLIFSVILFAAGDFRL